MIRLGTTLGLALLALSASAAPADDYATQWSLTLADPDAGAYAVVLDAAVYRQARSPALRDIDVLDAAGAPVPGLYCVGEAAGFGGGGASGKRSLEGTFLPGCILTARAAARAINGGG